MKKRIYFLSVSILIFFLQISYADTAEHILMDEVVVTATRNPELIHKVPANVTVITEEEIKKSCETTIPNILQKHAGIHFRSYTGNSSQAQIDLRGFGGDNPFGKTLILLNSKRLNRSDMASINWLRIPVERIERIEVVRGSACVLYGDSAIGGVINIITKKGSEKLKTNLSVTAGSNDTLIEKAGITGSEGKFSFSANAENHNTDGWRDRSAFSYTGGGINLSYDFDAFTASADISYTKTEYELPGNLTKAELNSNRRQFQPARSFSKASSDDDISSESIDFDIRIEKITERYGDIELKLAYNYNLITSNMVSWSAFNEYNIGTFGILPKYILDRNIFGLQNKFITGIDLYNTLLFQNKYADKQQTTKTDKTEIRKKSLGWYFKNDLNLREDLILGLGFRTEKATIEGEKTKLSSGDLLFDDQVNHHSNIFEIGITKLFGKSKLFGKFSTLYRYPFTDEHIHFSGKFLTELKPEKGKSYEIGYTHSPSQKLNVGITLFNIDMEDEIIYEGDLMTGQNRNSEETRHKGAEFFLSYDLKNNLSFYSNWIYHKATDEKGKDAGKELTMVPNNKLTAGIEIKLPYDLYLTPEFQYTGSSYLLSDSDNNTEKLDSYAIYGISLRYEPADKKLAAFMKIENIFNEEYSTAGYDGGNNGNTFYPAEGSGFNIGITFNF